MPRVSPQEATEKWLRRMQGAGTDYTNGVMRVTQAPGQAAARNVDGYVNGVQRSVANGKWQQNVAAVSLPDWQQAAVTKGAQRLAQGAQAAVQKVQAAHERIGPMIDRAQADIANMDRSTPEARIQRATAFMTSMMNQGNSGRGRRR